MRGAAYSLVSAGIILLATQGCTEHTMVTPTASDLVGKYKPETLSDKRQHADSEIELKSDGSCVLTDFPYLDFILYKEGSLRYLSAEGTWKIDSVSGSPNLLIKMNGFSIELNLLNQSAPYRLAQSGENVEFDELIFDRVP